MLMNSQFILDQAARFAERVGREAGAAPSAQLERAWRLAFARPPTDAERHDGLTFLHTQLDILQNDAASSTAAPATAKAKEKDKPGTGAAKAEPEMQALRNLCQALLSANEFLYVD
jgi:hypothetical protein